MSNGSGLSQLVNVALGGITHASLRMSAPHVCQMQRNILFATASSFVRPTPENKAAFGDLLTRLQNPGTHNRLLIAGHTDSVGNADSNRELSQRRVENAQAVLQGNTAQWEIFFSTGQGGERWGNPELTLMVVETNEADLGDLAAVTQAVNRYSGPANQAARAGLIQRYFARLLGSNPVPPIQTTNPGLIAYGEEYLLRGSRSTPSRDQSLPPIEGVFEPNRRVEFFFTTAATVVQSEYPLWTGVCTINPPTPTITVTIANVETIRKNITSNIQVTLTPSPLPWGTSVTLTLSLITGSGESRFTSTNSTTMTITQSAAITVRGVTASSTVDNLRLSATVTGQTNMLAQEDFTVIDAVSIYLKFEVWDLVTHTFEPLPAGVDVDIMDYEPIRSNQRLVTQPTDAQGRVFFNLPSLQDPNESEPDIFFLVHTSGRNHAHHTLPQVWSTKGWKAANGSEGYYEDYTGAPLGTPSAPLIFRIGLDFHARFVYPDLSKSPPVDASAPKRIPVQVHSGSLGAAPKQSLATDDNGEVHGVLFDVDPGDDFYFHLDFEMTDAAIHLPRARVHMAQWGWFTFWNDTDQKYFSHHDRTSLGTHSSPEIFRCTVNDRNVALYFLKILREWSIFLYRITDGAWTGVDGLVLFRTSASGVAYSWPINEVNIPPSDHWRRDTLAHELSHQIMWKEVNFSSLGIGYEAIFGDLATYHHTELLANSEHALIEGWAEFMEAVFEGASTPPYGVATVIDKDRHSFSLGPPPNNRGESVEGAFANGLWAVFQNHVVASSSAHVPESSNGDIMTTAAGTWLGNSSVKSRFLAMIWNPMKSMRPMSNPTTTAMISAIRSGNQSTWHALLPELQAFNMAMYRPTVTAISPTWGPVTGGQSIGQRVTITGTDFVQRTTFITGATSEIHVEFGGIAATDVIVNNSGELTCVPPPHGPSTVVVVVTTPAGSAISTVGYVYIDDPLRIIDIQPTTVSTIRNDIITISGQGFLPGAIVSLDGVPVIDRSVDIQSPTLIRVETPSRSSPGAVSVTVQNHDTNFDIWSGQLQYVAPPHVSFIDPPSGPNSGHTIVAIHGANFDQHIVVVFNQATLLMTWVNASQINIETPRGSLGPVAGTVTNPDGQSDSFEYFYT